MDTKSSLISASDENCFIQVNVDHYSNYLVTVPNPEYIAIYAWNSSVYHSISKIGPHQYLITDIWTKHLKTEIANCCILLIVRHFPGFHLLIEQINLLRDRK